MPVHRHQHDKQGTVYALKSELDEWWKGRRARIERAEQAEKSNVLNWPLSVGAIRTPVPSQVAARYEVLAEIGSGGMGVVYKARDRETGEIVALKVLRAELAGESVWMERFKEELRQARKVTHKNVCRIHDFVRTDDCAYISMEFVDGESLRQILNRFGALNARTCVTIALQICAGLQEAHLQSVIHRDLKPENIMLDHNGQIKLMDFGIACSPQTSIQANAKILGTPAYMAPEQAEGKPADSRADIYALGLILYEMITGHPAFSGDTPLEIALKQVRDAPAAPRSLEPGIPERLERAILRALSKTPEERFASAEEFASNLTQEFESTPVLEPAQTEELLQPVQAAHWQKSDWLLLASGIAGAILFFVLGGKVLPYSIYRLEMTRAEAIAKAESLVLAYAPELRHGAYVSRFEGGLQLIGLPRLAAQRGLAHTLEQARLRGRSWGVSLIQPGKTEESFTPASSQFEFDVHGNLTLLRFSPEHDVSKNPPANMDSAKAEAAKFAEEIFDQVLDTKSARTPHYDAQSATWVREDGEKITAPNPGANVAPVEWSGADGQGREAGVRIWLSGDQLAAAERILAGEELPLVVEEERPRLFKFLSEAVGGCTFLALVVIFIAKRLYLRRAPPVIVAAVCMALAMLVSMRVSRIQGDISLKGVSIEGAAHRAEWPALVFVALIVGMAFYVVLATPYSFASEACPERLGSLAALVRGEYGSRRVGLSVLRGILLGELILGLYVLALFVLGRQGLASFGALPPDLLNGNASGAVLNAYARSISGLILDTWVIILLPFAFVLRFTKKCWLAVMGAALFAFVTATGFDGMEMLPGVPYFGWVAVQILVMATGLWLTDLLTCMVAGFTIESFLMVYTAMQIFGKTEPWVQHWGLVPWILLALGGLVAWGKPRLYSGYRRLTAAFE